MKKKILIVSVILFIIIIVGGILFNGKYVVINAMTIGIVSITDYLINVSKKRKIVFSKISY